jgi:hypothetical protein
MRGRRGGRFERMAALPIRAIPSGIAVVCALPCAQTDSPASTRLFTDKFYFEFDTVKIDADPQATGFYVWGDKTLRTIHCKTCASVTHWEPLQAAPGAKHGVNLANFDPELIASVRVRRFDGANTWEFIDP